jgi:hypothetical protein
MRISLLFGVLVLVAGCSAPGSATLVPGSASPIVPVTPSPAGSAAAPSSVAPPSAAGTLAAPTVPRTSAVPRAPSFSPGSSAGPSAPVAASGPAASPGCVPDRDSTDEVAGTWAITLTALDLQSVHASPGDVARYVGQETLTLGGGTWVVRHGTDTASGAYRLGTTAVEFDPGVATVSAPPALGPESTNPPAFNAAVPVCADWQRLGNLLITEIRLPDDGLVKELWGGHIWNLKP